MELKLYSGDNNTQHLLVKPFVVVLTLLLAVYIDSGFTVIVNYSQIRQTKISFCLAKDDRFDDHLLYVRIIFF